MSLLPPQPMVVDSPSRCRPPTLHKKIEEVLLSRAGVAVFSRSEIEHPPLARDALLGYGITPKDYVHTEFQAYSIGADNSLHARDEDSQTWMDTRYRWAGVEVKSRVFMQGEMTPIGPRNSSLPRDNESRASGEDADNSLCARELLNVCTALRAEMRLQINQTCAFQVTLSHQTEGGLDLMSLKKIVTLAWILEQPLLFTLCAPHRRPGSNNQYCLPITEHSGLAHGAAPVKNEFDFGGLGENNFYWDNLFGRYVGEAIEAFRQDFFLHHPGSGPSSSGQSANDGNNTDTWRELTVNREINTLKEQLLLLWRVKTVGDLRVLLNRHMLNPGRATSSQRLSLAIKFLGFSAPPTNTAVEFRMHEGTLDPVLGKMWGDVCVALVKAAVQTGSGTTSASAGNSEDGGNGNGEQGGAFVDAEARVHSEMLRSMLNKIMGVDGSVSSVSMASTLLRELGISPRQISLWESKMAQMEPISARHISLNQEEDGKDEGKGKDEKAIKQEDTLPTLPAYPDLNEAGGSDASLSSLMTSRYVGQASGTASANLPSSSTLQVDVSSAGCVCTTRYTYASVPFLPEVQVCTYRCTGETMDIPSGTSQDRGSGHGGDRKDGGHGDGNGGYGECVYGSQQYGGHGGRGQEQGGQEAQGGPAGRAGQQEQAAHGGTQRSHVSKYNQPEPHQEESFSSTSYEAGHGASWIDPELLPQAGPSTAQDGPKTPNQSNSLRELPPRLVDANSLNASWVDPTLLGQSNHLQYSHPASADTYPVHIDDSLLDPMLNESFDMIDPSILLGTQD